MFMDTCDLVVEFIIPTFLSHRSGRQPKTYAKLEAAITAFELLMMGGVSTETC